MAIDMDVMLAKIKDRQWALADIDWDAPGADTITDEMRPKLQAFMADLCWIENIGARGFAALAKKAPTPTIAEIYRYFHAMRPDNRAPQQLTSRVKATSFIDTRRHDAPRAIHKVTETH